MDRFFKIITCLLLSAILIVQILILQRMPPTISDIRNAKGEDQQKLRLKVPVVSAVISQPVQVEINR